MRNLGVGLGSLLLAAVTVASPASAGGVDRHFPIGGPASYSQYHHDYPAADLFARCGTPMLSPVDGVVLELRRRDPYDPARDDPALRGGRFVSIKGDDGVRYYGSHLRRIRRSVHAGDRVEAGQRLGRVGQSGDAAGTGCHVHFGLSPVCAGTGDWWVRRGVIWPYRFLRSWEDGGDRSPRHAIRQWRSEHGCPSAP